GKGLTEWAQPSTYSIHDCPARHSEGGGGCPLVAGFLLHDRFDVGERFLDGDIAAEALLDLGPGKLLDARPAGELLQADAELLVGRQRLGELRRGLRAVAVREG